MFTGLIQDIGIVRSITKDGDWRVVIETALDMIRADIGASIACSGVCLTVVEKGENWFAADVSAETLSKTGITGWSEGTRVNLEPSLRMGDELGGHFVFGHTDGQATLKSIEMDGDSHRLRVEIPAQLTQFVAPKGSVTLDGVSLTVNEVSGSIFGVNIVPHTWKKTTLGACQPGAKLNIEVDMLARYVARMMVKDEAA